MKTLNTTPEEIKYHVMIAKYMGYDVYYYDGIPCYGKYEPHTIPHFKESLDLLMNVCNEIQAEGIASIDIKFDTKNERYSCSFVINNDQWINHELTYYSKSFGDISNLKQIIYDCIVDYLQWLERQNNLEQIEAGGKKIMDLRTNLD